MIQLIRVYKYDRVVAAEAYEHDERPADHRHPAERCRCIPNPLWVQRYQILKSEMDHDKITVTPIYLSTEKSREP